MEYQIQILQILLACKITKTAPTLEEYSASMLDSITDRKKVK